MMLNGHTGTCAGPTGNTGGARVQLQPLSDCGLLPQNWRAQ
jgi:hypothetical protein